MNCFVGVDIGTTNIKLLAMNPETDEILAHVSAELTTISPKPVWAEQDPEAIWQAFSNSQRNWVRKPGPNRQHSAGQFLHRHAQPARGR